MKKVLLILWLAALCGNVVAETRVLGFSTVSAGDAPKYSFESSAGFAFYRDQTGYTTLAVYAQTPVVEHGDWAVQFGLVSPVTAAEVDRARPSFSLTRDFGKWEAGAYAGVSPYGSWGVVIGTRFQ